MRWLALALLLAPAGALAGSRVAVIVGANAPLPGRTALRYAHEDARAMAAVLVEAGGFAPGDVTLLLDPPGQDVLAALDAALARLAGQPDTLLVLYYSGHTDGRAIYPGGRDLPLADLRVRLEDARASVRVGILDACRGGNWTGAKGLTPAAEFEVHVPLALGAEGSALLASSSGLQDAHESEALGGSFFTHHLVAGLRGAADRGADGEVTLGEAFDYARELTIRDSAVLAPAPQYPSYEVSLRGRRDLPLTRVPEGGSRVVIDQVRGPIQLVRLDSGLVVAEIPAGRRTGTVAVPPGRYLARRRSGGVTHAAELEVRAGEAASVREVDLSPVIAGRLASKGAPPRALAMAPAAGRVHLAAALGQTYSGDAGAIGAPVRSSLESELGARLFAAWGVSDRVALSIAQPGVLVHLHAGGGELLLWTGVDWSPPVRGRTQLLLLPGAGFAGRLPLGSSTAVALAGAAHSVAWSADGRTQLLDLVQPQAQAAVLWSVGRAVTLGLGASAERRLTWDGQAGRARLDDGAALGLGSVLELARRPVPLVQVHVSEWLSLDGHARVQVDLSAGSVRESYLGGATVTF